MAEIFAGAFAGVAAQELWNVIQRVAGQHSEFKEHYKRLGRALKGLRPVLDKLSTNPELEALCSEMTRGGDLISECAQVSCWNVRKHVDYSRRLQELEEAIQESRRTATLMGVLALSSRMGEINSKLDKLLGGDEVTGIMSGGSVAALPPLPGKVFGIVTPLNELKEILKKHQVVGVCGMGGSGKTTLVNSLCRDPDITGSFGKNIFYFTVSRSPDTLDILKRIWSQLLGGEVPRFEDVKDAVRQIAHGLSEQQIKCSGNRLIVLDDVWSEKDLKNLLFRTERLKTIVISREKMKKNIVDEIYPLPKLEKEAAKQLFYHAAGKTSPVYTMAAEQIIKRCDGLPLALEHIGGRLNGEPIEKWDGIAEDLQNKGDIYKSEEDLFRVFSTTIDFLCQQLRDCFLDIGSFPEDKRLPAASIIDMWVELYHLTEKKAFLKLFELSEKHLLNLTWRTR
ncbi:probable disease resistance protein At4g33300 [Nymphaea colorata]|nr:probable disease resistance protein At4g33300 [Nymphaea colorata]XP_031484126.1 probable disease resistance protein At4g33300 [Nymphaea colorata]